MKTSREEQIEILRDTAKNLRIAVDRARKEAAEWQGMADLAHEKADRNEETARVWELLAVALDGGQLDDVVVPLGSGREETTNVRIHALQGRLMAELADCDLDAWSIHCRELSVMWHEAHGGSREGVAIVAERLGIAYTEKPRGAAEIYVEAAGEIDGIPVKIWSLLDIDDEQPAASVEHVDYAEAEAVREIRREMAVEAGDDSERGRQIAEDDARHECSAWLAERDAESGA